MIANYRALPAGAELGLDDHGGQDTFYEVTPAKGARVEGVIAVRMFSYYGQDRWGKPAITDPPSPGMYVTLTPRYLDEGRTPNGRRPMQVNSKSYPSMFADVTLLPSSAHDDRTQWHPQTTVDGQLYVVAVRFQYTPGLTDMASKILRPLLEKIALEYVTTERWHQEHIQEAIRAVDAAKKVVAAKQADLDAANDALDKAWRTLESTVKQFAPKRVTQ
jgi:hypothetical protein